MITINKKGHPVIETDASIVYNLAAGPAWVHFFDSFKKERIFGKRCKKCERVLIPPRNFCPRCFDDQMEWVEVSGEGEIKGWSMTNYRYFGMPTEPPFITGLIRLDGSDVDMVHLIGGFDLNDMELVRRKIRIGVRVKAVWAEEKNGTIMDIRYFKPV